jgi:hypothetical protein
MGILLLVSGGGLAAVADPPGELVDGAGARALDALAAFAPWADRAAVAALDVPGAVAARASAERRGVQRPDPHREGADDG